MAELELDHVFVMTEPGVPRLRAWPRSGCATYQRRRPGQGTDNCCYAFDSAFLELLWGADGGVVSRVAVARPGVRLRLSGPERERTLELPGEPAWPRGASGPTGSGVR